ncbi:RNA helicase [Lysinibacillus sphaericus]|uniref:RNA helicase n=2 Tax=Lysinibacillus sphaericus TaxID=1421 RepID=A0A2S0K2A1_LYSSH|nr:RNA helicase [Lysinibacillus sphaericus]TKI20197.1 RNA helicase [Lysinibacillus sphaericus]
MKELIYYIDKGNGYFEPFFEYMEPNVGLDEFYARQLCTYFIMQGIQYELISNEMEGNVEVLVLREMGRNLSGEDERSFRERGIHIEFRIPNERENYPLLLRIPCETHTEVIRYLLKNVVDIPNIGQMLVTSTEIDEDRGVYVIYVTELKVS